MTTITIPKKLIQNDDLILIPRKKYDQLVRFWTSAEPISRHTNKAIARGFKEIAEGKFLTSQQAKDVLGL